MPRYFFFGLVRVQMYEYYWGHTAAQIQLIDIDQPITVYKMRDPNEGLKPGDKGWKPNAKKLEDSVARWKKRKAEREKRGFRLDKLLQTGEKVPVTDNTAQT
jgi:hypothetical protein